MHSITDIANLIQSDPWRMEVLSTVKALRLPDWAIGAGFIRTAVWDALHDLPSPTPLNDIDVLYFNRVDDRKFRDKRLEAELNFRLPNRPWSVKNQARMYKQNKDSPYLDTENAIAHWLEVTSCVGVRLLDDGTVKVIAPYGVRDLMDMRVRPTLRGQQKPDQYSMYINKKNWLNIWEGIKIEMPSPETNQC